MMLQTNYQGSRPYGFRQCFPYISLCKPCDPGTDQFWHQAHNLKKKLGRGPLGVIHTKYQDSMPYGFRQDFFMFFII